MTPRAVSRCRWIARTSRTTWASRRRPSAAVCRPCAAAAPYRFQASGRSGSWTMRRWAASAAVPSASPAECSAMRPIGCLQSPRVAGHPGDATHTDETMLPAEVAAPVVFVVGEDAGVRHSLIMLFHAGGFHARGFASALAFVRAAAWKCQRCCLVIDHHVPNGTDALALLECLRALGASVPAIIIDGAFDAGFR